MVGLRAVARTWILACSVVCQHSIGHWAVEVHSGFKEFSSDVLVVQPVIILCVASELVTCNQVCYVVFEHVL